MNINIFLYFIFILFAKFQITKAESDECNKLVIEGGERALKKIFSDFDEIKSSINILKRIYEVGKKTKNSTDVDLPNFDVRVDRIPEKCYKTDLPKDCETATECTKRSGIYNIQVEEFDNEPFLVACDAITENGGWLVIQKRQDGSVDFHRNWLTYESGFGNIEGEFFIGLKKLYALTNYNGPQELLITMEDDNGTSAFVKYDSFAIGNESTSYTLERVGKYTGTAGNSFNGHVSMKFSTKDRDNDANVRNNCATVCTGAWWYNNCHFSNLNGKYGNNTHANGINWYGFSGYTKSLPYVKMMIRRSRFI